MIIMTTIVSVSVVTAWQLPSAPFAQIFKRTCFFLDPCSFKTKRLSLLSHMVFDLV